MRTKLPANTPPQRDLRREIAQAALTRATRVRTSDRAFDDGWPVRVISTGGGPPVQPSGAPGRS